MSISLKHQHVLIHRFWQSKLLLKEDGNWDVECTPPCERLRLGRRYKAVHNEAKSRRHTPILYSFDNICHVKVFIQKFEKE